MEKMELKSLCLNAVKFIVILCLVDFALGTVAEKLFFSQSSGKQARIIASLDQTADLIVVGSSHANRHYVPKVFDDQLGLKTYNAGVQGQRVLFASTLQKMILKHHHPKVMIVNMDASWMNKNPGAYDRLSDLHPFYWEYRDILHPVLELNSSFVDVRMMSKAYRMNSSLVHMMVYFVKPQEAYDGYRPSYKKIAPSAMPEDGEKETDESKFEVDTNFVRAFRELIETAAAHEVKLIFVVSPTFRDERNNASESMNIMTGMVERANLPLFDFRGDTSFLGRRDLFFDAAHLNNDGAILFSSKVASEMQRLGLTGSN